MSLYLQPKKKKEKKEKKNHTFFSLSLCHLLSARLRVKLVHPKETVLVLQAWCTPGDTRGIAAVMGVITPP